MQVKHVRVFALILSVFAFGFALGGGLEMPNSKRRPDELGVSFPSGAQLTAQLTVDRRLCVCTQELFDAGLPIPLEVMGWKP